jgi:hypothetical protein
MEDSQNRTTAVVASASVHAARFLARRCLGDDFNFTKVDNSDDLIRLFCDPSTPRLI